MAKKSGDDGSWQPMLGAKPERRSQLGMLLRRRRAALGYRYSPKFTQERDINIRMVSDVEKGRRDTFTFPALQDIARAYDVTYDSMLAVVNGETDELEPAPAPAPVTQLPPVTGRERRGADLPYFTAIVNRLLDLAGRGITDPSGVQVFPASPDDARTWDGIGSRLDRTDRAWLIADLQRRADGRDGSSGSGEPEVTPQ